MIKVEFEYHGKMIVGSLNPAHGAGTLYHLMVDNYYWGQLSYTENFGWQFTSNKYPDLSELTKWFGEQVKKPL